MSLLVQLPESCTLHVHAMTSGNRCSFVDAVNSWQCCVIVPKSGSRIGQVVYRTGKVLVPGYTHLQRGQPIWFAHQLIAHAWGFSRDWERFSDVQKQVNRSPLGSAAMAGTPHPIDRKRTASLLDFNGLIENAMDGVSGSDHMQEMVSHCAMRTSHLSRLAAESILWSSKVFRAFVLAMIFSTGSSIMPQRNPMQQN